MTYQSISQTQTTFKAAKPSIVYRYLRPIFFDATKKELIQSSSGGVAFRFALNHSLNIISFTFCRCKPTQRFCHQKAKAELDYRAKTGHNFLILTPSRSLSLIDNVILFSKNSKDITLKDLVKHIKELQKTNILAKTTEAEFYEAVNQTVKERYYGT